MVEQPPQRPVPASIPDRPAAEATQLLIDRFLPRFDLAVAHAAVVRVPP